MFQPVLVEYKVRHHLQSLAPLRPKKLYLSTDELRRWELEQEPKPDGAEDDES